MTLNPSVHKNILVQILLAIYSDTTISPYLGFKGGTAAYLFYELERFSVDLDFDLLDESKKDLVFVGIRKILSKFGLIKEEEDKRFGLFFLLSYDQKEKNAQNIKLDINLRSFGSKYEMKSFMGISMLVMTEEDMFANKLVAMAERMGETNRDIFDVWFFAKNNWNINKDIIKKRTGLSLKDFLIKEISALEGLSNNNILDGVGELLNPSQKDWVRKQLKIEVIIQLKLRLELEK
jgi:predicted nucleotidyltransferase component of viral defense system